VTEVRRCECPTDDDTKNASSLELPEIVREDLSCRTVIPVSTLSLSASSSRPIPDHDVSVRNLIKQLLVACVRPHAASQCCHSAVVVTVHS